MSKRSAQRGSILKRTDKNGAVSWLLKYRDADGRQRYETVRGRKSDASARLNEVIQQIRTGTYIEDEDLTLAQWIDKWLVAYAEPSVSLKTLERYKGLFKQQVAPHIGQIQVQDLKPGHINDLYALLRKEGKKSRKPGAPAEPLSERSILHVHRVLSRCLKDAVNIELRRDNPANRANTLRPDAARSGEEYHGDTVRAMSQEQVQQLLTGTRDLAIHPYVVLALGTGMRLGEILALQWTDIDLEKQRIRIARSVEETSEGKRFKAPKNRSSGRTIGIDETLAGFLKRYHLEQKKKVVNTAGATMPKEALVFPKSPIHPTEPRSSRALSKEFRVVLKKLGDGLERFRFHDLRHTHATILLSEGVPITAVSQRLGHSGPHITLKTYSHLIRSAEDQAVAVSGMLLSQLN